MLNKLTLVSDFRDWYDHMFDMDGVAFSRMIQNLGRRESLTYIKAAGWRVPRFGDIMDLHRDGSMVVVHNDEYAHQGYQKTLVDLFNYPHKPDLNYLRGLTCVEYMCDCNGFGVSYRDLWVGDKYFRLKYESKEWRSNVGEVSIAVLDDEKYFERDRPYLFEGIYPLLALDYVLCNGQKWYIDLNTSPGIPRDIGMTATEVVSSIKSFVFR